ncbi:MAG: alpha-amylase, partial [Clostridia bacterium]|nr:alpha-amylase [Clostridia bacterium]
MKRKLLALLLALVMVLSLLPAALVPDTAVAETIDQTIVEGGAILHCFDWSYNEIKAALPDIKAAGYVAVQTSPVQQPKDYNAEWTDGNQWWKLYQPLGFTIADGDTWLGTKAELTELCTVAEDQYGIKVIVDVVANHLANKTGGGGWEQVNENIDPDLYYPEYFHTNT